MSASNLGHVPLGAAAVPAAPKTNLQLDKEHYPRLRQRRKRKQVMKVQAAGVKPGARARNWTGHNENPT